MKVKWKYSDAMKILIPFRKAPRNKRVIPANKAGLFSFLSISWLTRIMWKAFRQGLTHEDVYEIDESDAKESAHRLELIWKERVDKHGCHASLISAVWRLIRTRCIISILLMNVSFILQFIAPTVIQKMIIDFVSNTSEPLMSGLVLVLYLFAALLLRNFFFSIAYTINIHTAARVQAALQQLVYTKVLHLQAGDEEAIGRVLAFCSSEQDRVFDAVHQGTIVIGSPLMFAMAVAYSVNLIGFYALIGNCVVLIFYPIIVACGSITTYVRTKVVTLTHKRINLMSEIVNSIKLIKMYAWEEKFSDNVKGLREQERVQLQRAAFLLSFSGTITPSVTILAAVSTFVAYTLGGNELNAQKAFTVFSVFSALQFSMTYLPYGIKNLAEIRVSFKKMEQFLLKPDMTSRSTQKRTSLDEGCLAITMKGATFQWNSPGTGFSGAETNKAYEADEQKQSTESSLSLRNIDLSVRKGQLIGVCGAVGAGKTSLLAAITGDMQRVSGDVAVRGSLAIVTQQAWIFNETLRENILFGESFEELRYQETVEVCSLHHDLALLPGADMTEIGERGSNLSGGQKQRVNLGRAVYADKDVYLLDDPLSAVDAHVAQQIFRKCIRGRLRNKTILLVTHGIQFLEECDEVLYIKDGEILERGTHSELSAMAGEYAKMLTYEQKHDKKDKKEEVATPSDGLTALGESGALIEEEKHKHLGFRAYVEYLKYAGGVFVTLLLFLVILAFTVSQLFASLWLQIWIDAGDGSGGTSIISNPNLHIYQIIYAMTFVMIVTSGCLKGYVFARQLMLSSSRMHDAMLRKLMLCPVAFFDVTPAGRILQRFSKDMDELDVRVSTYMEYVSQVLVMCIGQLIVVCVMYPIFSIVLCVAVLIFSFLEVWLNTALQQTKSLDSIRKAPVLSHLASTMAGLSVIRTYGREQVQQRQFQRRLDSSLSSDLLHHCAVRWFTFHMDMVCVFLVVSTALMTVLMREGAASSTRTGLALSSVFVVSNIITVVLELASQLQARFTSVERVLEYTSSLPQEAPHRLAPSRPAEWPARGHVLMEEVQFRYRPGLPLVLQNVNADIKGGEKVGVVGRTGAGKSSLINTLLRFTELAGGRILIDGVDISTISLHQLRSSIAVIPQDPVLFEGTVRFNLDPFEEHSDESIWEALEKSHVRDRVVREGKQLLMPVNGGGQNLSVGEKQLLCLARALLRRNKILLLDEATASVDVETDFLIQRTIREAFQNCTVLTIAHRLHTVSNHDRVMVIDAGKVLEFDTPTNLLQRNDSVFRKMVEAAGSS